MIERHPGAFALFGLLIVVINLCRLWNGVEYGNGVLAGLGILGGTSLISRWIEVDDAGADS